VPGRPIGSPAPKSGRLTAQQRREQLISVALPLFATRGLDGTSIEEISAVAGVSKPVIYEHFGGKEGLYAVIVDREVRTLIDMVREALSGDEHPRVLVERAAIAMLTYIEDRSDGFRILVRDAPATSSPGAIASMISDATTRVEGILANEFKRHGFNPKLAPMYAQMLVGMVALTGQWWLEVRSPSKRQVASHVVNLAWNGLAHLEAKPVLRLN
jgi:AcrR family transcriptional regulator